MEIQKALDLLESEMVAAWGCNCHGNHPRPKDCPTTESLGFCVCEMSEGYARAADAVLDAFKSSGR